MSGNRYGSDLVRVGRRPATRKSAVGRPRVFAIFDAEHDRDLYETLLAQSGSHLVAFDVVGGSNDSLRTGPAQMRVRSQIRNAGLVVVICGEHTQTSYRTEREFEIMLMEKSPYFLLWGRREVMCTKPTGAKPSDRMYSWTPQVLQERVFHHQNGT